MKIYSSKTVYEVAKERIHYLFDEFDKVVVSFSGGKDSTVCLHLTLEVAAERGIDKVPVLWLDQEAEFQSTVDYVDHVMRRPDVEPFWIQVPFRMSNATSAYEKFLQAWDPAEEDKWIHPKSDLSIKENTFGKDRFYDMFGAISKKLWPYKMCYIGGMRTEESPMRYLTVTCQPIYKHITWATTVSQKPVQKTFYPIYDWSYRDVWKYIFDNNIRYNKAYDHMYQYGYSIRNMRVSSLHHEQSVIQLFYLQEIEPETWNRCVARLPGINTAGTLGADDFHVTELPRAFKSWREYRDYLVEHLIVDEGDRKKFKTKFKTVDKRYQLMCKSGKERLASACVQSIVTYDYDFVKIRMWERNPTVNGWLNWSKGKTHASHKDNSLINETKAERKASLKINMGASNDKPTTNS